jgi:hypothetical protein
MGPLFLLRVRRIGLAIALALLGGGLDFIRSGGLGGFIGAALLLIGHSISFHEIENGKFLWFFLLFKYAYRKIFLK